MAILNGRLGQVVGPFPTGKDLLDDDGAIGAFTPEEPRPILNKLGIQAPEGTVFYINNVRVQMGKTGMYELENTVAVKKLYFESETTSTTLVDFVY